MTCKVYRVVCLYYFCYNIISIYGVVVRKSISILNKYAKHYQFMLVSKFKPINILIKKELT